MTILGSSDNGWYCKCVHWFSPVWQITVNVGGYRFVSARLSVFSTRSNHHCRSPHAHVRRRISEYQWVQWLDLSEAITHNLNLTCIRFLRVVLRSSNNPRIWRHIMDHFMRDGNKLLAYRHWFVTTPQQLYWEILWQLSDLTRPRFRINHKGRPLASS